MRKKLIFPLPLGGQSLCPTYKYHPGTKLNPIKASTLGKSVISRNNDNDRHVTLSHMSIIINIRDITKIIKIMALLVDTWSSVTIVPMGQIKYNTGCCRMTQIRFIRRRRCPGERIGLHHSSTSVAATDQGKDRLWRRRSTDQSLRAGREWGTSQQRHMLETSQWAAAGFQG